MRLEREDLRAIVDAYIADRGARAMGAAELVAPITPLPEVYESDSLAPLIEWHRAMRVWHSAPLRSTSPRN